jgi:hypothetical protein
LSSKSRLYEDELPKFTGLSSKTTLNEDELPKFTGLSSKTRLYEDELPKFPASSSKSALYEDEEPEIRGVVLKKKLRCEWIVLEKMVPLIQTTVGRCRKRRKDPGYGNLINL